MELLGDVGHVESCFSPFGDSVSVSAKWVHDLRRMFHRVRNRFGHTRRNCLVTWVMWNLVLVHLEIVLVSMQDRCMVCAKCPIGSEMVLDGPDRTPT